MTHPPVLSVAIAGFLAVATIATTVRSAQQAAARSDLHSTLATPVAQHAEDIPQPIRVHAGRDGLRFPM